MKYVAPYAQPDPDASYVNGNPTTGVAGSIPPAAAFEHPMREIVKVITEAGIAPDDADLTQLWQAIGVMIANALPFATLIEVLAGAIAGKAVDPASLASAFNLGAFVSGQDTGAANALVLTLTPAPLLYSAGMEVRIAVANRNTGATTINVNGLGAKAVVNTDGSPLVAGTLLAGQIAELVYDGAQFQLTSSANAGAKYWRMTSTGASLPDSTLTVVSGYGASDANMPASTVNASAGTVTIGAADAGVYVITTSMAAAGDGVSDLVLIQVNGTPVAATQSSYPTNIAANDPSTAAVVKLSSGDVVRIVYFQVKTGGGTTVMVNDAGHHFSAVRVSR
jgi:hypothetical protein